MSIDLAFRQNQLLLNPRLPTDRREIFAKAWRELAEPDFERHVGIVTSGSSGNSFGRLIILSKDAIEASARAVNERFGSGPHDIWFKSLPSFHVGGLGILVRAKLSGATVYEDREEKWNAEKFAEQLIISQATLVSLVPTQVFDLVQAKIRAPRTVRSVIVGGGRLEDSLRKQATELGWPCLPSYGMTETASQVATALNPEDPRLVLLAHADAKTSVDGHLVLRSSSILTAQISFDSSGVATLTDPKVGGWFTTEDLVKIEDRALTIEGRAGDFIKIAGEGVVLARLEEHLERLRLTSHFTKDAAIIAAKDSRLGAVLVMLSDAPKAEAEELAKKFNEDVAPFERIRRVECVDRIPRSELGKLQRGLALSQIGLEAFTN